MKNNLINNLKTMLTGRQLALSKMHRVVTVLGFVFALGISQVWGTDVTLFTTNFSTDDGWTTESIITSTTTSATRTIKGTTISFKGYKDSDLGVVVGATSSENGTLTFTKNNISASAGDASSANYYMAIPVTGVNGSLTVTTTGDATKWYYSYDDGSNGRIVARQQASANHGFTISGLSQSSVTIYMGNNAVKLNSITITTPSPACETYSFRYKDNSSIWHTYACFDTHKEGGFTDDYITAETELPVGTNFYVGWGDDWSETHSLDNTVSSMYAGIPGSGNEYTFNDSWQIGKFAGAKGYFHIYTNSDEKNKAIRFVPSGYTLQFGSGDWTNDHTLVFVPSSSDIYEAEWLTDVTTLTADQISKKVWVGYQTSTGYVWCPKSEKVNLSGLRTKTGSDSWHDGGLNDTYAGKTGKFRMYANSGDSNFYLTFVPYYNATFVKNNGQDNEVTEYKSVEVTNTVHFPNPEKAGYTLEGWYETADFSTERFDAGSTYDLTSATGSKTFYAKWTEDTSDPGECADYFIYWGKGDSKAASATSPLCSADNTDNKLFAISGDGSLKTGSTFTYKEESYTQGVKMESKTLTYTPKQNGTIKIYFDGEQTVTINTTDYTTVDNIVTLDVTKDTPYNITKKSGTHNYYIIEFTCSGGGSGTPATYSITVVNPKSSCKTVVPNATAGQSVTVSSSCEVPGMHLTGYTSDVELNGKSFNAETKDFTFIMPARDVTLTMVWAADTYTLTYDGNGHTSGTVPNAETNLALNDIVTLAENTGNLVKTGYVFSGWNTKEDGTGTNYNAGATFTITENTTLYARWKKQYTVTLDKNGGDTDGSATVVYGSKNVTNVTDPTRENYTIEGFYAEAGCTTKVMNADHTLVTDVSGWTNGNGNWIKEAETLVLYTKWESTIVPGGGCVTFGKDISSNTTYTGLAPFTIVTSGLSENATKIDGNDDYISVTSTADIHSVNLTGYINKTNETDRAIKYYYGANPSDATEEHTAYLPKSQGEINLPISGMGVRFIKIQRVTNSAYVSQLCITTVALPSCTTPVLPDLANATACFGGNWAWDATQTAVLATGESVSYRWEFNSQVVGTTAQLNLTDISTAAAGTYTVYATVTAEGKTSTQASKEVTLTVNNPTISQADGLTEVQVGGTLTLSAAAGGTWTSSSDAIAIVSSGVVTGVAAGEATITYTLGECEATYVVTVVATKTTPTFTWKQGDAIFTSGDLTLNAGGSYAITVETSAGAEIPHISMESIVGVSYVAGAESNMGTLYITPACAVEGIKLTAAADENGSYLEHEEEVIINITNCGSGDLTSAGRVPMAASTDNGSGSAPRYNTAVDNVGWLAVKMGSNSYSVESSSYEGFTVRNSSNEKVFTFSNATENVVAAKLYLYNGTRNNTVVSIYQADEYFSSTSSATDVTSSVNINYYKADGTQDATNLSVTGNGVVELIFTTPLSPNMVSQINFANGVRVYGIEFFTTSGGGGSASIETALAWETNPGETVEKTTDDMSFQYVAVKTGDHSNTLGAITYASSNTGVATVASDGTVTIKGDGEAVISAKLAVSGCYLGATISYNLHVTEVTIQDPTDVIVQVTGGEPTDKCASAEVTMTAAYESGSEIADGATYQWYKNDKAISGAIERTYTTADAGTYTVAVKIHNAVKSTNSIKITNRASASVRALYEYWYIKQGRETNDLAVFEIDDPSGAATITLPADASGKYSFYRVGDVVYLRGTAPTTITSNEDAPATLIINDGCGDVSASMTLHLVTETAKPELAFVVANKTHLNDLNWTAVESAQTTQLTLYKELEKNYTVQATNIYATNDISKIRAYYSQFDILLVTDYPNTKQVVNKSDDYRTQGYVNALGSMVDIRPILTMEAFVSALENWQTKGDPTLTAVPQFEMLLMCQTHEIFAGTSYSVETIDDVEYYKVTMVDKSQYNGADQAMQGFAVKDLGEMVAIGKIHNEEHRSSERSSNLLMACVERQQVGNARMMVLGINSTAMSRLTADGVTVIKNTLEYLLKDGENISDCAMIFDNGAGNDDSEAVKGDNSWNNLANWGPLYNSLPTEANEVRIAANCTVPDNYVAKAAYVKIKDDVQLTISPQGTLLVDGMMRQFVGTKYVETTPTSASQIKVRATEANTGALIQGDKVGTTRATVEMYSKANIEGGEYEDWNWQYIGVPFNDATNAFKLYPLAYLYVWNNSTQGWVVTPNQAPLTPFAGYCITQDREKTYTMTGTLAPTANQEVSIANGYTVVGNSWTAPIDIKKFTAEDFSSITDNTVYMFNTGCDKNKSGVVGDGAGQYVSVPILAAPYTGESLTVIPAMQGFYVSSTTTGSITLDYDRLVRGQSTSDGQINKPMRVQGASRAAIADEDEPNVLYIKVSGTRFTDYIYILEREDFSTGFDNGWDGEKWFGESYAPQLYVVSDRGIEMVDAIPSIEGTLVGIQAGEDDVYIMTFEYDADAEPLYIKDTYTNTYTRVMTGNSYMFSTTDKEAHDRFILTHSDDTGGGVATNIEGATIIGDKIVNASGEQLTLCIYDASGKLCKEYKTTESIVLPDLPITQGVYMVYVHGERTNIVKKVVK